jgi:choline dehydrogenase-like flavoprotein
MITDLGTLPEGTVLESDICIIGGGAVAIVMAKQFANKRLTVNILESGGLSFEQDAQALAAGTLSGVPYFPLTETSFRMLGGNTFRWGARTSPLKDIDFAARDWLPRSGWPLTRADLDPYYERAFDFVGLHRPFRYEGDVWAPLGRTPPAFDARLLTYCAFQFGKNVLLGEVYRRDLEQAPNVNVYLHATVQRIACSPEGNRVSSLEVATVGSRRYAARARHYVLACGGIENPRMLLASNDVHSAGLCNEHDLVGRFFMEHPTVSAGRVESKNWQALHDVFSPGLVSGRLIETGLALSPAVQQERQCLHAIARTSLVVTRDATQALREIVWNLRYRKMPQELKWYRGNKWLSQRLRAIAGDPLSIAGNLVRHALGKPKRFRIDAMYLEVRLEQEPNPESRVTLSEVRDTFGAPRAHLHWALTERDKHSVRTLAQVVAGELTRLDLGMLKMADWLRSPGPEWPSDLVGGHHHMGTTRMSDDPRTGVVDRNCRTHAIANLFIAGSSVFPSAGYVNPTSTILALALRLADHLEAQPA